MSACKHCQRQIVATEQGWADPLANGDDLAWRFSCDKNDTFQAQHEVDEPYCCDAPRPEGFTYHQFVTVCDTCLTQFPYYECFCELVHEDCNEATRLRNIAYRETAGINIQINTLIDAMVDSEKCLFHNSDTNLMINSLNNDCPTVGQ